MLMLVCVLAVSLNCLCLMMMALIAFILFKQQTENTSVSTQSKRQIGDMKSSGIKFVTRDDIDSDDYDSDDYDSDASNITTLYD